MGPASSLPPHHVPRGSCVLLVMAASLIFLMDLMNPLGMGGGVPSIGVVLLHLRHRNFQIPLWTAAGCSLLIPHRAFLFPTGRRMGEFDCHSNLGPVDHLDHGSFRPISSAPNWSHRGTGKSDSFHGPGLRVIHGSPLQHRF